MADTPLADDFSHACDHVVRSHAGGLVDDECAIHGNHFRLPNADWRFELLLKSRRDEIFIARRRLPFSEAPKARQTLPFNQAGASMVAPISAQVEKMKRGSYKDVVPTGLNLLVTEEELP